MNREDLASLLSGKNNDYFRNTTDTSNDMYIYDNAINTARRIVMQLGGNVLRTNHVMLIAKMQSGKTSVCNSVVNIINRSKLYKDMSVKKFLFITGMNDCGLKNQTYERVINQIIDASVDNTYFGKRCKRNLSENKYFVLKNSDLMSYDGGLDNSVIFIDESHYGTNEKNILSQFLYTNKLDWRNTEELIKRNIYIVSVSATPFDELVSDTIACKRMVELNTDNSYVGISEYLKKDVIFEGDKDDVIEDGAIFDYIEEAEDRMIQNDENGVIIIRTRNFSIIENNPYVQSHFDIFEMYSSGSKIEYAKLNNILAEMVKNNQQYKFKKALGIEDTSKPLIVLIKGAFRAGITLDASYKDIIYMIYDYSIKSDTTAQALLGRMCGYRKDKGNIAKTHFYVNKKFAYMYSNWENDFQNRELIPCDDMKWDWVSNDYEGHDVRFGSRSCGNFYIELSDEEIIDLYKMNKGKRNRSELAEKYFPALLGKNDIEIDYNYINECHMSGKNNYAISSQNKRFNSFSEDSLVFQFRPSKMKKFMADTNRDTLEKEDVGKKCVSLVLDAEINEIGGKVFVSGNKRLLVYYVEVGQKKIMLNRKKQYKAHKDTNLNKFNNNMFC